MASLQGWGQRTVGLGVVLMLASASRLMAQGGRSLGPPAASRPIASIGLGGGTDSTPAGPNLRTLEGQVKDADEKPLPGALVFVKNLKTSNTLTVTADDKGHFRFVALARQVDYQFWAEQAKGRSDIKKLSSFDDSMHITRNLMITAKPLEVGAAAK